MTVDHAGACGQSMTAMRRAGHAGEELDERLGRVRGEAGLEADRGLLGRRGGAGDHGGFVLAERGLDVVAVLDQGERELGGGSAAADEGELARAGRGHLPAPDDPARIQRGDEHVAQDGPVDLRPAAPVRGRGVVDEDLSGLVQDPHALAERMGVPPDRRRARRRSRRCRVPAGCGRTRGR
jgi:hypothetical protein